MDPPPDWLTPLPDAETMRSIDRWAISERGVEGIELMERAGGGVARAVERIAPDGPVTVVCGKGNNGGDGLVVARLLREGGREVTVVCVASPDDYEGDARINLERLPGDGPVQLDGTPWDSGAERGGAGAGTLLDGAGGAVVDALLGTGFDGVPHGAVADAIEAINASRAPTVAVDVPSGVDASTGIVGGLAVHATATVTFHAGKPGLWINPGKRHAGAVETVDIGIPGGAPMTAAVGLIGPPVLRTLPRRDASWTKFTSGQVLVAGGSRGLSGAAALAARASMRAGAGYVTACVPLSLQPVLAGGGTPEMMTRGLPEDGSGGLVEDAAAGRAEGRRAWRRARARPGPRAQRRSGCVRAPARARGGGAARARRRRAQRPRAAARRPRLAPRADGAHPACGRARAPARVRE